MSLYTSDVDTIYKNIRDHTINPDSVRVLSSTHPHSISLLEDFVNIEEIYCNIICHLDQLNAVTNLISHRHKLSRLSLIIYIPSSNPDTNSPPPKRRCLQYQTPYEKILKNSIPDLIKSLGRRMRYLNLIITVVDPNNSNAAFIMLNKGTVCITSNNGESKLTQHIFTAIYNTDSLLSFVTKGDSDYDLTNISSIPELTIISRKFSDNNPINKSHLKTLFSLSEVITLIYEPHTIDNMYLYSDLIIQSSNGSLKQIKGIVPLSDVEDHIILNPNLEEIHTLVRHKDDVLDMEYIIQEYQDRTIRRSSTII